MSDAGGEDALTLKPQSSDANDCAASFRSGGSFRSKSSRDDDEDEALRKERGLSLLEELKQQMMAEVSPANSFRLSRSNSRHVAQSLQRGPSLFDELKQMFETEEGQQGGDGTMPQPPMSSRSFRGSQRSMEAPIQEAEALEEQEEDRRRAAVFSGTELSSLLHTGETPSSEGFERLQSVVRTRALITPPSRVQQGLVVWACTWNVANLSPPQSVVSLLRGEHDARAPGAEPLPLPDIYVIGLQETDTSVQSALMLETQRGAQWASVIEASLRELHGTHYVRVARKQMGGVLLVVLASAPTAAGLTEIATATLPLGVMGVMGNKGAIGVRFKARGSSLCVVSGHLGAGDTAASFERRCQDLREVSERLVFTECLPALPAPGKPRSELFQFAPPLRMSRHDRLILLGDLNFRVQLSSARARELVAAKDWDELWHNDELYLLQVQGERCVRGLDEGRLEFPPTYKYDVGSDQYDSSYKARAPSWTDRVLWKGSSMSLLHYAPVPAIRSSDHRPLIAILALENQWGTGNQLEVGQYRLEQKRAVDASLDQELVRKSGEVAAAVGGLLRSSADYTSDAVGTLFSSVGISQQKQGQADNTATPSASSTASSSTAGLRLKEVVEGVVTPENFASVASGRLDQLLDAESLPWESHATVAGVHIQSCRSPEESMVMLRAQTTLPVPVAAVASLLWAHDRREEWDATYVDGALLQKYDHHHVVLKMVRGLKDAKRAKAQGSAVLSPPPAAAASASPWASTLSPEIDLGVLMSRHTLPPADHAPPAAGGGASLHAEGGMAVLLQSVRHRLLPPARKYVRGHLYWEGYIVSPAPQQSSSVSVYLRLSADPIPQDTMWRFGQDLAASIAALSASSLSSPASKFPPPS